MVKYYFASNDGEVFINLPSSVSRSTLKSIMMDCNFSKCFILVNHVKMYLDLTFD